MTTKKRKRLKQRAQGAESIVRKASHEEVHGLGEHLGVKKKPRETFRHFQIRVHEAALKRLQAHAANEPALNAAISTMQTRMTRIRGELDAEIQSGKGKEADAQGLRGQIAGMGRYVQALESRRDQLDMQKKAARRGEKRQERRARDAEARAGEAMRARETIQGQLTEANAELGRTRRALEAAEARGQDVRSLQGQISRLERTINNLGGDLGRAGAEEGRLVQQQQQIALGRTGLTLEEMAAMSPEDRALLLRQMGGSQAAKDVIAQRIAAARDAGLSGEQILAVALGEKGAKEVPPTKRFGEGAANIGGGLMSLFNPAIFGNILLIIILILMMWIVIQFFGMV